MNQQHVDEVAGGRASGPASRPSNFVAAALHDEDELDAAIGELAGLGIDQQSIAVLSGQRGADAMARRPRRLLTELLSDEDRYVERFAEEIGQGALVIGVALGRHDAGRREQVAALLQAHGAHFVVSRTPWTYSVTE